MQVRAANVVWASRAVYLNIYGRKRTIIKYNTMSMDSVTLDGESPGEVGPDAVASQVR